MKKIIITLVFAISLCGCSKASPSSDKINLYEAVETTSITEMKEATFSSESNEENIEISVCTETIETTIQTTVTEISKQVTECESVITTEKTSSAIENYSEKLSHEQQKSVNETTAKTELMTTAFVSETEKVTQTTVSEYVEKATETPTEAQQSDYEKALEIYEYMRTNGSGTCVQYSYQTYEMCISKGLECYFIWTENKLYGHVANAVKIDGVWYVMDTQAGGFLINNDCGFTEIVDEYENHIAYADIISGTRYE